MEGMRNLNNGSTGAAVELLLKALLDKGFNPGGVDGHCGQAPLAAVLAFQHAESLVADGTVGANREVKVLDAIAAHDFTAARRLVNGGTHGLDVFVRTYTQGGQLVAAGASENATTAVS
jgi:peptidoglycan hydrolase-like protein with peptidoglycan-binding domain